MFWDVIDLLFMNEITLMVKCIDALNNIQHLHDVDSNANGELFIDFVLKLSYYLS